MKPGFAALAAVAALFVPTSVAAQAIDALCLSLEGTDAARCACAEGRLVDRVGREDATLYEAVGTVYMARRQKGLGMGEAWDAGLDEIAREAGIDKFALLQRMSAAGEAHRAAIRACG
jgi:uncharacterized protein YidB (DUF937 family)